MKCNSKRFIRSEDCLAIIVKLAKPNIYRESAVSDMERLLRGTMWLSAEDRHKHCQALCKPLQHNCSPWEECDTPVTLMVRIHHHIPGIMLRRKVCDVTGPLNDEYCVILRQRVQGSIRAVRAVRAVRNTRMFQTDTRVFADQWTRHTECHKCTWRTWVINKAVWLRNSKCETYSILRHRLNPNAHPYGLAEDSHYSCTCSICQETAWHRIVGILKNLQNMDRVVSLVYGKSQSYIGSCRVFWYFG